MLRSRSPSVHEEATVIRETFESAMEQLQDQESVEEEIQRPGTVEETQALDAEELAEEFIPDKGSEHSKSRHDELNTQLVARVDDTEERISGDLDSRILHVSTAELLPREERAQKRAAEDKAGMEARIERDAERRIETALRKRKLADRKVRDRANPTAVALVPRSQAATAMRP